MKLNSFTRFHDRQAAGRLLAKKLNNYTDQDVVIYALPRGGIAIGAEVAEALHAPLDIVVPRKIGHPIDTEYAIAAISETGKLVMGTDSLTTIDEDWLSVEILRELKEAERRRHRYMKGRPAIDVEGKTAIITDDGVATGLTMRAAIVDVQRRDPAKIIVAVPIIPEDTKALLVKEVDNVIALVSPKAGFGSIGQYYDSFEQVDDDEVIALLNQFD